MKPEPDGGNLLRNKLITQTDRMRESFKEIAHSMEWQKRGMEKGEDFSGKERERRKTFGYESRLKRQW